MEAGALDLSFMGIGVPGDPFVSRELFRERFVGLICARHPLAARARRGKVTLTDYLAYPHMAVSYKTAQQSPIESKLHELGHKRRVVMTTPNFAANVASLFNSDLIVSLPSRLVAAADQKELVLFKLPMKVPGYPYFIAWHRRTNDDPALVWLRDLII